MNKIKKILFKMLCLILFAQTLLQAAGLLTPNDGSLAPLQIKDHAVKVVIQDGYTITTIEQGFYNPHSNDLEAIYSFPVPNNGTVSEFTMWIDGKPITGEVLEKQKARHIYNDQKSQGNDTGIVEKNTYQTFDISVFPVRQKKETHIRLVYIQPTHIDHAIGKYVYQLEEGGVDSKQLAFWTTNEEVTGTFSFDLHLRSSVPINSLRVPNYPNAKITNNGHNWHLHIDNHATTPLHAEETAPQTTSFLLNKDIVVYFKQTENLPGSVELITYKPDKNRKGTFMMTITPGNDLKPIIQGRDWVFILDISGSMNGKYATLANGVKKALHKLPANDRFKIVLFNIQASELTSGYTLATKENVNHYTNQVRQVSPSNGTNLFGGINLGLSSIDADRPTGIILVTDGVANVGETQHTKLVKLTQKSDLRFFTFIMGNSANKPLLEHIAEISGGFAMTVSNTEDIVGNMMLATSKLSHQAMHKPSVSIKGVQVSGLTPENPKSLYRGEQLIVFGHYRKGGAANVTFTSMISGEKKTYKTSFHFPEISDRHPELERLWAYATIENLAKEMTYFGEDPDIKQAITDLAVEYGLVTDYTSMLIVKEEVFKQLGITQRNKKRVADEHTAGKKRASKLVNSRVDKKAPMFNSNRAYISGGSSGAGSFDPISILIAMITMSAMLYSKKTK